MAYGICLCATCRISSVDLTVPRGVAIWHIIERHFFNNFIDWDFLVKVRSCISAALGFYLHKSFHRHHQEWLLGIAHQWTVGCHGCNCQSIFHAKSYKMTAEYLFLSFRNDLHLIVFSIWFSLERWEFDWDIKVVEVSKTWSGCDSLIGRMGELEHF